MAIAGDDASQPCGTTIDSVASPTSHFPSRSATSAPSAAPSCSGSPGYPPVRRAAAGFTAVDRRAATGAASQGRGAAAGAASPGRRPAVGAAAPGRRAAELQREPPRRAEELQLEPPCTGPTICSGSCCAGPLLPRWGSRCRRRPPPLASCGMIIGE